VGQWRDGSGGGGGGGGRLRACGWWAGEVGVGVREDACTRARLDWEGSRCPSQQRTTALHTSVVVSEWRCVSEGRY
jgi:hypothetical protein